MKQSARAALVAAIMTGACGGDSEGEGGSAAAGVALCERAVSKLEECGLQVAGECSESALTTTEECQARCFLRARCATVEHLLCNRPEPDETDPAVACYHECEEYQCESGNAGYSAEEKCDGTPDCRDGSDEADCPMFTCESGMELPSYFVCDGSTDCATGEDEKNCPEKPTDGLELSCPRG